VALLAAGISGCGGATVSGRTVFANDCQVCHSISVASSPAQQGGDLRHLRLPRSELLQYAAEMPALNGRLSTADRAAVVGYLQAVERR
jgi:mono/diheme cytochrome c family protein